MDNIPLVIFFGILATTQIHIAKAMERQGIEVFEQIKVRLQKTGQPVDGGIKKPVIYTVGLILNNTEWIWAVLGQRFGPPAVFTSMFGIGLVFLLIYAARVMHEPVGRSEILGSAVIVLGTLVIGIEHIFRQDYNRFAMNINGMLFFVGVYACMAVVALVLAGKSKETHVIGLAFGFVAGGLGGLDPFLKGVGQSVGGQAGFFPNTLLGWLIFVPSFLVGFLAFLVTQIGFAKKARASILVPAYNATYIVLPIVLQLVLLPSYKLTWLTGSGVGLIIAGLILMRRFKR